MAGQDLCTHVGYPQLGGHARGGLGVIPGDEHDAKATVAQRGHGVGSPRRRVSRTATTPIACLSFATTTTPPPGSRQLLGSIPDRGDVGALGDPGRRPAATRTPP